MYSHAPEGYRCFFCEIARTGDPAALDANPHAIVYHDDVTTVLVPPHHYAGIRGNVLVIPNAHYENIFDIDYRLGADLLRVSQAVAFAMKRAYQCEGISTRQHNEPAGYQDAWHFHLHVFPRYSGDNLYGGVKARYEQAERMRHAALLRSHLGS